MCSEISPRPWAVVPEGGNRARVLDKNGGKVTGIILLSDALLIARAVTRPGVDGFGRRVGSNEPRPRPHRTQQDGRKVLS